MNARLLTQVAALVLATGVVAPIAATAANAQTKSTVSSTPYHSRYQSTGSAKFQVAVMPKTAAAPAEVPQTSRHARYR